MSSVSSSFRQGASPQPPLGRQRILIGERIVDKSGYKIPAHILNKIRSALERQVDTRNPDLVRKLDQDCQAYLTLVTVRNQAYTPYKAQSAMDPFRDLMFIHNAPNSFWNARAQPFDTWAMNEYEKVFENGPHEKAVRECDIMIWNEVSHILSPHRHNAKVSLTFPGIRQSSICNLCPVVLGKHTQGTVCPCRHPRRTCRMDCQYHVPENEGGYSWYRECPLAHHR